MIESVFVVMMSSGEGEGLGFEWDVVFVFDGDKCCCRVSVVASVAASRSPSVVTIH